MVPPVGGSSQSRKDRALNYDIDLPSAGKTLQTASEQTKDYEDLGTDFSTAVESAAKAAKSGIVGKALGKYATDGFAEDIKALTSRTGSAITHTNDALTAYSHGNEQMMNQNVAALKRSEPQHGFGARPSVV
jgi:uncharacterized protein with von Willebrand factor type A (vWA) domain